MLVSPSKFWSLRVRKQWSQPKHTLFQKNKKSRPVCQLLRKRNRPLSRRRPMPQSPSGPASLARPRRHLSYLQRKLWPKNHHLTRFLTRHVLLNAQKIRPRLSMSLRLGLESPSRMRSFLILRCWKRSGRRKKANKATVIPRLPIRRPPVCRPLSGKLRKIFGRKQAPQKKRQRGLSPQLLQQPRSS